MGRRWKRRVALLAIAGLAALGASRRYEVLEKRVAVVEPGRLVRGAWQRPGPLGRIIDREGIRTVVTLTAINTHDPKYVDQEPVLERAGVDWVIVPMRGSTATLEQLAEASDLLADPSRRPVFFHCVAGHHRTNLAMAAYRVRHCGWSAGRAWAELCSYPWTRPGADGDDRRLIERFAASPFGRREGTDDDEPMAEAAADRGPGAAGPDAGAGGGRRHAMAERQSRDGRAGRGLPLGPIGR